MPYQKCLWSSDNHSLKNTFSANYDFYILCNNEILLCDKLTVKGILIGGNLTKKIILPVHAVGGYIRT